ncbi:hypothetical protein EVAR_58769_1 [Eumeta japonica]|uniref:Uncharacterized protein n=1 Tax=Eumeta variegata TaxID=151549 RepID=A0A4C1ZUL3_EUMVA|nr:hypothetical protein EVAR_58769_1 [Eumeta japonica]
MIFDMVEYTVFELLPKNCAFQDKDYLPPVWFKLELKRVAEAELKAGLRVKLRKEPESKSKAGPGLK